MKPSGDCAMTPPDELGGGDPAAEFLARGFAERGVRWARDLGCDKQHLSVLRSAAYETSLATSNGHVCITLEELAATGISLSPDQLRSLLSNSGLVGRPDSPGANPFILDADGRLYLHRYFDYERRLARRLMQAAGAPPRPVSAAARDLLNTLFPPSEAAEVDWQKLAAALALRNGLTVISGGPGTGKTTTVVNLLACLITQDPASRIALAAPTGKAAARMTEAIRQRGEHLPAGLREKLPREASTIHRLLGANPGLGRFAFSAASPLPIDVLIVDEASMLDLALACRLLEAVPASARIILLGDKDQLAAVESGAVFAELCADPTFSDACRREVAALCGYAPERIATPAPVRSSALRDAAVWLTKNYRFAAGSDIGKLAEYVNQGRAHEALDWLGQPPFALSLSKDSSDRSVRWLDAEQVNPFEAILSACQPYFDAILREPRDIDAVTRAFNRFRTLCAVRHGPSGVTAVNERITRQAHEALAAVAPQARGIRSPWFAGRPVMVLRNDYVHKLFNGDIGITLPDADGELAVFFPNGDQGYRAVPLARMPEHETAFAMTVHKAQGSEFDAVLVSLPPQRSRVVTRELLYTAVTRAKSMVVISAGAHVLAAAIQARSQRHSGLISRISDSPPSGIPRERLTFPMPRWR